MIHDGGLRPSRPECVQRRHWSANDRCTAEQRVGRARAGHAIRTINVQIYISDVIAHGHFDHFDTILETIESQVFSQEFGCVGIRFECHDAPGRAHPGCQL